MGETEQIRDQQDDEDKDRGADDGADRTATGRQLINLTGEPVNLVIGKTRHPGSGLIGIDPVSDQGLPDILPIQKNFDLLPVGFLLLYGNHGLGVDHPGLRR